MIFLSRLKAKRGDRIKPLIVTDAGFMTSWFKGIAALRWNLLDGTRHRNFYTLNGIKTWQSITRNFPQATAKLKAISSEINRSNPLDCRFIIYKKI